MPSFAAFVIRLGDVVEEVGQRRLLVGALELLGRVEELAAIVEQHARVIEQPAQQRTLAVVDTSARDKAKQAGQLGVAFLFGVDHRHQK